jgi:hypothetical protein
MRDLTEVAGVATPTSVVGALATSPRRHENVVPDPQLAPPTPQRIIAMVY